MQNRDYWQAILERNRAFDGKVVYGVRSTGIYCRPSCPSKKPNYETVVLFARPELAEQAGFRPCRRCQPDRNIVGNPKVELARRVCRYIEAHLEDRVSLEVLSRHFAVSPAHLQRSFTSTVGLSPREYAENCRMNRIKDGLRKGASIAASLYDAGYASSSQLYGKAPAQLGMTPSTYKKGGRGIHIAYATSRCRLGYVLVAATERGICAVQLGDSEAQLEEGLRMDFAGAKIERDDAALLGWVERILHHLEGQEPHLDLPLDVDIRATAFQRRVWQALQEIPYGSTRSYAQIANAIGQPRAVRAVGRACATNPTALLVPCHRATQSNGGLGGYRWGTHRKRAILAQEKGRASGSSEEQEKS
jgi:AraC family transcriptional regulator of adaptative response/methylated-DNA-[protein]-cysteine methyltransferase